MSSQKTILITGCSRGIGLALVKEYISRGWQVLATCRSPARAGELSELLKKHHQPPAIALDMSDDATIDTALNELQKRNVLHLDVLFNNAGVADSGAGQVATTTRAEMDSVFSTNVSGPMVTTQKFLPMLKAAPQSKVVFMSTIMSSMEMNMGGGMVCYRVTKAALNMLTRMFAGDVKGPVYVAMHPGWVQTDLGNSVGAAPLSPEASCRGMADVIDGLTAANSGKFIDYRGGAIKW